jgi:hypothetical protein
VVLQGGGGSAIRSHDNSFYESAKGNTNQFTKAQPFLSPTRQSNAIKGNASIHHSKTPAMNHILLNDRSEVFVDDTFENIEKRCFFLMCGKISSEPAISIEAGINAFDDPRRKKNLQVNVQVDQIVIEYNNEILKNLTNLALEYRIAFNFSDLHAALGPNRINKKKTLQRMIELQAPLFAIKKQMLKSVLGRNVDFGIKILYEKHIKAKEESKPQVQKQKEDREKQIETINKIKKLDRALRELQFDVVIKLHKLYFGLAGEKEDYLTANSTQLEVCVENQIITLLKQDYKCIANVCGVSITTLNSFEMLFIFANKL